MKPETLILILTAAVLLIVAGLAIGFTIRRRRSEKLRQKFGLEYDYAMEKEGDRRKAEEALVEREKQVSQLNIHDLNESERNRYQEEWIQMQAGFVDEPLKSVEQCDRLITEVMIARGFPVADFEQRAADLSVLYPDLVIHYRSANDIAAENRNDGVSTETLRQAMVDYRSVFAALLGSGKVDESESDEHVHVKEAAA